jgi:capsular polysaccharide transport system permease protein
VIFATSELVRGYFAQRMIVRAVVLREVRTRFGTDNLGYLWALVGPAAMILMFAAIFAAGGSSAPTTDVVSFLATGVLTFFFFRNVATRCAAAIDGNKALLFYPQVRPFDLIVARSQLEVVTVAVVFIVLMGGNALWRQQLQVENPLGVVLGLGLAAGLGVSLGLVLCGISAFYSWVDRLTGLLLRPLMWTSGVFYSVNDFPPAIRDMLLLNPVLHCVELTRDSWFPEYTSRYANPVYPLFWVVGLMFLGLVLERVSRRKIEVT